MNAVRGAEESFMAMPAEVRSRFGNDPQAFVEFCSDEANLVKYLFLNIKNRLTIVRR